MVRNHAQRVIALLLCIAMLGCISVSALEYTSVSWKTADDDVIDSLYGVTAKASENNCWEYVYRFYLEYLGVKLQTRGGGEMPTILSGANGRWFVQVSGSEAPQTGDILSGSAEMRGSSDHYAIVKSYDAATGEITIIEENFKWNGSCAKDRVIPWPSSAYNCYRLVDAGGAVIEDLSPEAEAAAEAAVEAAEEEVTLSETAVDLSNVTYGAWAEEKIIESVQKGIYSLQTDYTVDTTREMFCQMAVNLVWQLNGSVTDVREAEPGMTGYAAKAYQMGIIDGDNHGNLNADKPLTRQEAVKILDNVFRLVGELPTDIDTAVLSIYDDADKIDEWAVQYVASMTSCGVITGTTADYGSSSVVFDPNGKLSLQMAIVLMMRLYNDPTPTVSVFA